MKRSSFIVAFAALLTVATLPASAGIQGGRSFTAYSAHSQASNHQSYALTGQTTNQAQAVSNYAAKRSLQGGR